MFMTKKELLDLTGKKSGKAQSRVLTYMGIDHAKRPDGSPAVLKSHVEKVLSGAIFQSTKKKYAQPDFSSL